MIGKNKAIYMQTIISVLLIFRSCNNIKDNSWKTYEDAALMISNQSPKVKKLFKVAKEDNYRVSENSIFEKAVKKNVDPLYYATFYDFGIEKETNDEVVSVAFMIIMYGLGYMQTADWKTLSDEDEVLFLLDILLKKHKLTLISEDEKKIAREKMSHYFKGTYAHKKQIDATNEMVALMNKFVIKRGYRILWFQNNSDSYSMFVVKPEVYKKLSAKELDDSCSFSIPTFTLERM